MSKLTGAELVELVTRHGFPDRVTAIAIVLGESGGNPSAVNREANGNVDRGLWQISSRWHPQVTDAEAFSVEWSTRYALQLSKGGTDWTPWHARKSPRFPGHIETARGWVNAAGTSKNPGTAEKDLFENGSSPGALDLLRAGGSAVAGAVPGVSAVGDVLGMLGRILGALISRDFWTRAGYVSAGLVFLFIAFQLFSPAKDIATSLIASKVG